MFPYNLDVFSDEDFAPAELIINQEPSRNTAVLPREEFNLAHAQRTPKDFVTDGTEGNVSFVDLLPVPLNPEITNVGKKCAIGKQCSEIKTSIPNKDVL